MNLDRYEDGRLTLIRTFSAPLDAVFDAWINTSKVPLWWGCADGTEIQSTIETYVGGCYSHLLTLRDKGEYRHHGKITAFDPPHLLEYELTDQFAPEKMMVRVEFRSKQGETEVVLTQSNLPEELSNVVRAGWRDGMAKLGRFLATEEINQEI